MNKPIFKCMLYALIAALTAFSTEIANFTSFSEISTTKWSQVIANILLQSFVAIRAFVDQSISNTSQSSSDTPNADNKDITS